MPRDKRLYMTFPIDIHRHPKLQRLSADAKWAFVEMNGEARLAGNDGRFTAEDAQYMWSTELLDELLGSHPTRPLIVREGTDYVIRDYAEHQQTAAAVEELREKRSAAGRQGAEKTNGKRSASAADSAASAAAKSGTRSASAAASAGEIAASARQTAAPGRQSSPESESESESELETDNQLLTPIALDPAARDFSNEEIEGFRKAVAGFGGDALDDLGLLTLVELLLEASPRPVSRRVGYVIRCTERSPQKVRALAAEAARQAARVHEAVAS